MGCGASVPVQPATAADPPTPSAADAAARASTPGRAAREVSTMPKDGASDEDIIAFICAELKRDSDRTMRLIDIAKKRAQAEGITLGSKKLPDGVDMNSLPMLMQKATQGADGQSQQAREYQNAFERDGGSTPKQVEEVSRLVDAVEKRGELSTQLSAWQAYGLQYMLDATTTGRLRLYGEEKLRKLIADLQATHGEGAFTLHVAPPKGTERASMKTQIKYAGDVSRLCDLNRVTVECKSTAMLIAALTEAVARFNEPSALTVEVDDRMFSRTMKENYRHVQMLIRLRGILWEVQLNLPSVLAVKKSGGHSVYKTTRHIREDVLLLAMRSDARALKAYNDDPVSRDVADPNAVTDKDGLSALHHGAVAESPFAT